MATSQVSALTKSGFEPVVWKTQQVRVTGFCAVASTTMPDPIWANLIGKDPENENRRPGAGIIRELGPFFAGGLSITQQLERIDFRLQSENPGDTIKKGEPIEPFPGIGELDEVLKNFQPVISRWLQAKPILRRVAFGSVLVCPVDSPQVAHSVLTRLLKSVNIDELGIIDFRLSINKPVKSEIMKNLTLNRLTKWSVEYVRMLALDPGLESTAVDTGKFTSVKLEIDINTEANRSSKLPTTKLKKLFHELKAIGQKIVEQGEPT